MVIFSRGSTIELAAMVKNEAISTAIAVRDLGNKIIVKIHSLSSDFVDTGVIIAEDVIYNLDFLISRWKDEQRHIQQWQKATSEISNQSTSDYKTSLTRLSPRETYNSDTAELTAVDMNRIWRITLFLDDHIRRAERWRLLDCPKYQTMTIDTLWWMISLKWAHKPWKAFTSTIPWAMQGGLLEIKGGFSFFHVFVEDITFILSVYTFWNWQSIRKLLLAVLLVRIVIQSESLSVLGRVWASMMSE